MPTCPACGQDNPEIAKFCLACGTPLGRAAVAAEEERRVVTAVFTDLVGSTSRAERLDAEDVRALLTPYYTRLRGELERHGGTVEKFIGDAVVALFGAPVTHEDDAERAVRAALAIQAAIAELNEGDAWLDLRVRIGVNTGEALVVLGARASEGEGMAAGDVMNTAARLQSQAPVNGIAVGAETYRATAAQIEYREAEPIQAKGKSEPVRVWEVVGVREEVSEGDPGAPLVGRAADVEVLRELWERVRVERSRLVAMVVGAAGIGKSRLLAEFLAGAGDTGRVLRGRCLSYGEGITYGPVTEIVKDAAGILRSDGPETISQKLGSLLDGLPTVDQDELRTMAVAVANLLGAAMTPQATYAAAEISGHELHWGIRRVLELLAIERPLVLVLEDLHWAEPTLLDLIRYVGEGSATAPMLVVGSARPELLESRHPLTSGNGYRRVLELDALSDVDSEALLAELTQPFELPVRLVQALLRKAAGNPLFLEETARMLIDGGFLGPDGLRGDLDSLPVPSSLQALIGSRLDRLPTTEKGVAQHASVVGAVFWTGAVAALAQGNGELEGALDGLGRRDIVRAHDVSSVAGEREYAFKHMLIRDVAYGRLPKGHRVELHVRFADWLCEAPGAEDDFIEILAYHLEQACRLAGEIARSPVPPPTLRAARALARAADKAERREGWREAHRYYERALELIGSEEPDLALELRLRRARMLGGLGELREACEELTQVADDAVGRARPDLRCAALVTLGNIDQRQGRPAAARQRLLDARGLASALGDRSLEVRAAFSFAALRADFDGAYTEAVGSLRHAVGVAEEIDDHALRVEGHLRLGFLLFNTGELVAAEGELRRCSELAAEVGSFRDQARAVFLLGLVTYYRGDPREAERLNLQAGDWLERTCEPFFQIQNFRALGLYALARHEPETAERWLREAIPLALEEGGRFVLEAYRYLAEALLRQGRIEDAAELVEFAGRNVPEEDLAAQAYVLLARAGVAAERAERDTAESCYRQGVRLLEEQQLPIEVGEARIGFAQALRRFGALTEARAQLELARDAFERMGAGAVAAEIERELVEVRSGAGAADPARSQ